MLIQYQILQINIATTVWKTVRRIAIEILGVKELIVDYQCIVQTYESDLNKTWLLTKPNK